MPLIDTSCLIYLTKVGKLDILRKLFHKVVITQEVYDEMKSGIEGLSEFQEAMKSWISIQHLEDRAAIHDLSKSESVSHTDAALILLAQAKKDILISNDAALIRVAKIKGVDCWWLTTCVIEAVRRKILKKAEAKEMLLSFINRGMYLDLKTYAAVLDAIEHV